MFKIFWAFYKKWHLDLGHALKVLLSSRSLQTFSQIFLLVFFTVSLFVLVLDTCDPFFPPDDSWLFSTQLVETSVSSPLVWSGTWCLVDLLCVGASMPCQQIAGGSWRPGEAVRRSSWGHLQGQEYFQRGIRNKGVCSSPPWTAAPGNLLEMDVLRPHPRPSESETGVGPSSCAFAIWPGSSGCTPHFENCWFTAYNWMGKGRTMSEVR